MKRSYFIMSLLITSLITGCGGGGGGSTPQQPSAGGGSGGASQTPTDFTFTSSSEFSACESDSVLATISASVSGLSWALSGEDADSFSISSSGNISWSGDSLVESEDGDAVFEITVTGSGAGYNENSLEVTISINGALAITLLPESPLDGSVITAESGFLRSTGYVTAERALQTSDLTDLSVNGEPATLTLTEDGDLLWDATFPTELQVNVEASASCGGATETYSLRRPQEYSHGVELIVDGQFFGLGSERESGNRVFVIGDLESQTKEVLAFTEEAETYSWVTGSITDKSFGAGLYDGAVFLADGYRTATSNSGSVNSSVTRVPRGLAIRADGQVIDKTGVYSWIEAPIFRVDDPEKDFLVRQTAASRCWAWARVYANEIMLLDTGFVDTPGDCAREVGLNSRTAEVEFFDPQSVARFEGSAATVQVGDEDYYPFFDGTKLKGQAFGNGETIEFFDASAVSYPDAYPSQLYISPDDASLLTRSVRGKIVRTQLQTEGHEVLLNGVGPQTGGFIGIDSYAIHQGNSLLATGVNTSFECEEDLHQYFTIVSLKTSATVSRPVSGSFLPCREERKFKPTVFDKNGENLIFASSEELLEYNVASKTLGAAYSLTTSWADDEGVISRVVGEVSGDLFVLTNKNLWVHNLTSRETARYPLEDFYQSNLNGPYNLHLDEERGLAYVQAGNRLFQFDLSDLDAAPSVIYESGSYLPTLVTWNERPGKFWVSNSNDGFGILDIENGTLEVEEFPSLISVLPQRVTQSGLFVIAGLTYFDPKTKSIIFARN